MSLLNYTTTIAAVKTIGEIQQRLAEHGVAAITVAYVGGEPAALAFSIATRLGTQTYRLPANIDAIERLLERLPRARRTRDQATRAAWQ